MGGRKHSLGTVGTLGTSISCGRHLTLYILCAVVFRSQGLGNSWGKGYRGSVAVSCFYLALVGPFFFSGLEFRAYYHHDEDE